MIHCNQWDIILVPFPFTNLMTTKKRPALVISPDEYNCGQDLVMAFITSQIGVKAKPGDHLIERWRESGLPKPSMLRMKIATIERKIVIRKLGCLAKLEQVSVSEVIQNFFA